LEIRQFKILMDNSNQVRIFAALFIVLYNKHRNYK
jgi:hypothetical protein